MSSRSSDCARSRPQPPRVLPVREQARVVNSLLKTRLDRLLPELMRETGFDLWLVICHEDNHDPVFDTIVPFDTWAPILQMLALCLEPDGTVRRLNVSLTNLKGLYEDRWGLSAPEDQWATLRRIVQERDPRRIGIDQSDVIWAADGLTASLKDRLVTALGPVLARRLASAQPLCIRWLATMIDDELPVYEQAVRLTHHIVAEAFSPAVITPGVTTTADLCWFFAQRVADHGLKCSFTPFFNLQRAPARARRHDPADGVIRPGDMIHCDVGLAYMRFITDVQENAYVPDRGEAGAPAGLREALRQANRLQDILTSEFVRGRTGNEILASALAGAAREGLSDPRIYTHSVGHLLHEPGPLIGLPWEQKETGPRGEVALEYDSCFAIELGVRHPVAEWDGAVVSMSCEQDAFFGRDGVVYLDGRQTELHIVA